jgi:hypothetical protein
MEAERLSYLTLNDIYTSTDEERKSRAKNQIDRVDIPAVHQGGNVTSISQIDKEKPATFDFKVLSGKSHIEYKAYIMFQENVKTTSKVKVACRCPDFGYRSAWVMNGNEALYNNTSFPPLQQQQAPDKTNPDLKEYMCKHLLASVDAIYNEGIIK